MKYLVSVLPTLFMFSACDDDLDTKMNDDQMQENSAEIVIKDGIIQSPTWLRRDNTTI